MKFLREVLSFVKQHSCEIIGIEIAVCVGVYIWMRKNKPYKFIKMHGFTISIMALFILIIYTLEAFEHFLIGENWISIADNIFSGAIFSILCIVTFKIENKIKNKVEDKQKLRQDYTNIAKKYVEDNLITIKNSGTDEIKYPIIWMGKGNILLSNKDNIEVVDYSEDFYQLPAIIENNFKDIFSVHDTSTIYNNINIRVKEMKIEDNKLYLTTERTTFYNSLVTNRAADYLLTEGLSVREIFETGPRMTPLCRSKLSNHLGFNGFIESADGYIVFVKRSRDVSIGKETYGDSIGASMKTKYALDGNGIFNIDGLEKAIKCEIVDELSIEEKDIDKNTLSIISIYRDCVECGKPQLLIYAKTTLNAKEITNKFTSKKKEKINKKKRKMSSKERKEIKMLKDGSKLVWIHKNDLIDGIIYEENGIKIKEGREVGKFVTFNNNRKKKTKFDKLRMVPSASASVYMIEEYLKSMSELKNKEIKK